MKITLVSLLLSLLLTNTFAIAVDTASFNQRELEKASVMIEKAKKISPKEFYSKGTALAKKEKQQGIKRVLRLTGPFDTTCFECIYQEYGFVTYNFGSNDIEDENRNAFIEGYNREMTSSLTNRQKNAITNSFQHKTARFNFTATTIHQINATSLNDSVLNLKVQSDSLEVIFKSEMKFVMVEFKSQQNDAKVLYIDYNQLKNNGIDLPISFITDNKLLMTFDLSKVPNNYAICWCNCLNNRYSMTIPLKMGKD